ncbi:MAG TPA: imidazolonepropionase [Mycobacteriales bacterium]|nr:imidazolonepropionase [Mycobacteriales bacterium]
MNALLLTDIGELTTNTGDPLQDAAIVVEDGRISWFGPARKAPAADRSRSLGGRAVIPAFVDSHTHLVFAGDRSAEFATRMGGAKYEGGGIATTVEATGAASDDELRSLLHRRIRELQAQGTGAVEIKSGYGLTVQAEARLLRLAAEVTDETTLLAHVVPPGADRAEHVGRVCGPMIAECAPLARWIDVFCEPASPHAFDGDESRAILEAGAAAGLGLRVHGNQLAPGPGIALACELGAASVDHCTYATDTDIEALAGSGTAATLLPAAEFCTRSPYPRARDMLAAGVTLALATDCNPGTSPTSSMPFVIALAVRELQLTPAEAIHAATAGAAQALRRDDLGVVRVGAPTRLTVIDGPSAVHLAYRPGMPVAELLKL